MTVYRIVHLPTQLQYGPVKYKRITAKCADGTKFDVFVKTNLSAKGKIYTTKPTNAFDNFGLKHVYNYQPHQLTLNELVKDHDNTLDLRSKVLLNININRRNFDTTEDQWQIQQLVNDQWIAC